jgi:HSP20 family molecular chaperone IbpA
VDISERDSQYNLEAELPGINLKDIDVKIDNRILTIKENKEKKEKILYAGKILWVILPFHCFAQ